MFAQVRPAILEMAHLRRAKVLASRGRPIELDVGMPIFASFDGRLLELSVPTTNPVLSKDFPHDDARFWRKVEIDIVVRTELCERRYYFVCPYTGLDCLKLAIREDIVCSVKAFKNPSLQTRFSRETMRFAEARRKLLKEDGSLRMSPDKRKRLMMVVAKHPQRYRSDEALLKLIERHAKSDARRKQKFLWEARAISTTRALDEGRGINQHPSYGEYLGSEPPYLTREDLLAKITEPSTHWTWNFPELDMKVLLERRYFDRQSVRARVLGWSGVVTGGSEIAMFLDLRSTTEPSVAFLVENRDSGERAWQEIKLLPGPNSSKPRYFLCPVSHVRTETLYFRHGFFASPQAHRLKRDPNWQPPFAR